MDFRWNTWNLDHATTHGVSREEAEHVVRYARRPYPRRHKLRTWIVVGRGTGDRVVEVIYMPDDDEHETVYIIHAMPLSGRGRRRMHRH